MNPDDGTDDIDSNPDLVRGIQELLDNGRSKDEGGPGRWAIKFSSMCMI